ncbi:type VI secretion system baseplate subunit TssK [Jannaschia pohangensis]|uniref:Type VI secretion system protein ImpJ n=1 Tax=Jannaschia pohangensis TaxID=390807 RepID=A0A1I3UF76_9RHOB|nr:type VI secretion system baseplate subunit TssK [Jannaschia pohangensis]SFJ82138.1 type VI secretion system protein ImpJ [Jannaschia pohangensis]
MSWFSKVAWQEGLFLQPQHLQQADRYHEAQLRARTALATPYPWGLVEMKIDRDLAQQGKLGLRAAVGIMPDGTPFDAPGVSPLPDPIPVPDDAAGLTVWLSLPDVSVSGREVGMGQGADATRWKIAPETVVDNAASGRIEQSLELAHPRLELSLRKTPRTGYQCLPLARIAEVRNGIVAFDDTVPPTALTLDVHPVYLGYLSRVIGWIEGKLDALSRYASDPSSGGGMQATDYLMLMVLNRELPALRHFASSKVIHPERLFERLVSLAGELATFDQGERRAADYAAYDHDDAKTVFGPVVADIQRLLARDVGRAVRLPLREVRQGSYAAIVNDRQLFASATFVVEVGANLPLTQIQAQFPQLCKVGPSTRMKEIINNNLPGVGLVHLPNPPRHIRVVASKVYFVFDKSTDLWREFSVAPAVGMHFAGTWPDLRLELWAVPDNL